MGYGRLLLLKIALFADMVTIASVNRFRLTPRFPRREPTDQLACNMLIEVGPGFAILATVSVLGLLPPAAHIGMQMH